MDGDLPPSVGVGSSSTGCGGPGLQMNLSFLGLLKEKRGGREVITGHKALKMG